MESNLFNQERLREGPGDRGILHHLLKNKKENDDLTQNSVIYGGNNIKEAKT